MRFTFTQTIPNVAISGLDQFQPYELARPLNMHSLCGRLVPPSGAKVIAQRAIVQTAGTFHPYADDGLEYDPVGQ